MKYARIVNNISVDVRTEHPEGFFTPEIVAEFVEVPDEVENGWILEGGIWSAPPTPEPTPEPQPVAAPIPPKVSPVEFILLFKSSERVSLKALRTTDQVLDDLFDVVEDPRLTVVDLSLTSTQDALDYMIAIGQLTAERKAEILTGTIQ